MILYMVASKTESATNLMWKKLFTLFLLLACGVANAAEFKTKAKSAFLIDYDSGAEIVAKNADTLMPPSSMIKLMTLAVLFDEIKAGNLTFEMEQYDPQTGAARYRFTKK